MRNKNWTMIIVVLCVLAGLLYFMKQSDFMKQGMESTVKTSMDVVEEEELDEGDDGYGEEWQADIMETETEQ